MDQDAAASPASPNRTAWLLLSYMWIAACCVVLPAVPLIVEREDDFAKWHAKHGLVLGVVWLVFSFGVLLLANIFGALDVEWLKASFYAIWCLGGLGFLVLCAVALMRALEGHRWTLGPLEQVLSKLNF